MKPIFQVAKCVNGPDTDDWHSRPWFITETNFTSDGPRTRICEGRWATQTEAEEALQEKEREQAQEQTIHPRGRFAAKLKKANEIKRSISDPSRFHVTMEFETEHGQVFVTVSGSLDTLTLICRSLPYYKLNSAFVLDVKHVKYGKGEIASASINWEHTDV